MFCKHCGKEIKDGDKFCSNCGAKVVEDEVNNWEVIDEEEVVNAFNGEKRAGFKDGIKALFSKTFSFKGTSNRSEFNFGLLFIIIITSVISMIVIYPVMYRWFEELLLSANTGNYEEMINGLDSVLLSKDLFSPYNFSSLGISLLYIIFLTAPVYRRMNDIYGKKKIATIAAIVFAVGQMIGSPLLYCLLNDNVYNIITLPIDIITLCSSIILILCIFKKGYSK